MKMYARTNVNYGCAPAEWTEVKFETKRFFPSGLRPVLHFINGIEEKADRCEIIYVFEK